MSDETPDKMKVAELRSALQERGLDTKVKFLQKSKLTKKKILLPSTDIKQIVRGCS